MVYNTNIIQKLTILLRAVQTMRNEEAGDDADSLARCKNNARDCAIILHRYTRLSTLFVCCSVFQCGWTGLHHQSTRETGNARAFTLNKYRVYLSRAARRRSINLKRWTTRRPAAIDSLQMNILSRRWDDLPYNMSRRYILQTANAQSNREHYYCVWAARSILARAFCESSVWRSLSAA